MLSQRGILEFGNFLLRQFQFLLQKLLDNADMDRIISMQRDNSSLSIRTSEDVVTSIHADKFPSLLLEEGQEILPCQSWQLRQER